MLLDDATPFTLHISTLRVVGFAEVMGVVGLYLLAGEVRV